MPIRSLLAGKYALPITIAVFALGFATAELYERRVPWGLEAQRNSALERLGEMRAERDAWRKNRDGWFNYAQTMEAELEAGSDRAAGDVAKCSTDTGASVSRAFDNGYAAGLAAGRRSCGANNASGALTPVPGPGGVQPSGQTLSERWGERAYRPAGDVPANR